MYHLLAAHPAAVGLALRTHREDLIYHRYITYLHTVMYKFPNNEFPNNEWVRT